MWPVDRLPQTGSVIVEIYTALAALEARFPDLVTPDSPTQRVGSDLDGTEVAAITTRSVVHANDVDWSPDGARFGAACNDDTVRVFSLP